MAFWDQEYEGKGRLWGDGPSELALSIVGYLQKQGPDKCPLHVLDLGCGYGRDAVYLSAHLPCRVLGVDISELAIQMARNAAGELSEQTTEFRCCDWSDLESGNYDIIFASNVYHTLRPDQRKALRRKIKEVSGAGTLVFLNTLSANDREEYGKGEPVAGEMHSFQGDKYLHFSTREELAEDFSFLEIKQLYEIEYDEPRGERRPHHHKAWILVGEVAHGQAR